MSPSSDSQFHPLIEAALTGRITAHEHDQLEQALEDSPELRQEYLRAMEMHLDLAALSQQVPPPRERSAVSRPRSHWPTAIASAAGFSVTAALLVFLIGNGTPPAARTGTGSNHASVTTASETVPAASPSGDGSPIVVEAAHARIFGEWHAPVPGERIALGRVYVLTHGFLSLEFATGAKTVLKSPCVFSAIDRDKIQIRSGQCSVYAPPGAEGFQVISPAAEVVDLGTRFLVDVAETGETELFVVDGEATMSAPQQTSGPPILLREGEAARIEPGLSPQYTASRNNQVNYLSSLPDRVIRYQTTFTEENYADELLSVTVQRGGQRYEYDRAALIPSRVTHFVAPGDSATFCTRQGEALPEGDQRLGLLDGDWSLVTGVINPRLLDPRPEAIQNDPILSVEFLEPIVNGPGADILLFDLQLLVYPPEGDRLRLRSGDPDRPGFAELNVSQFDIDLTSPFALDLIPHRTYRSLLPTTCLDDLITNDFLHGKQVHVNAKALVVGIDLSDLGYAPGETLTRLDLMETSDQHKVDPVLIVGLPSFRGTETAVETETALNQEASSAER